jgi:hypothetical protein
MSNSFNLLESLKRNNKLKTCEKCNSFHKNIDSNKCNNCDKIIKCVTCDNEYKLPLGYSSSVSIEIDGKCKKCAKPKLCKKCKKKCDPKYEICYKCAFSNTCNICGIACNSNFDKCYECNIA